MSTQARGIRMFHLAFGVLVLAGSVAAVQAQPPPVIKADLPDCIQGFSAGSKDAKGGYDCTSKPVICPGDDHVLTAKPYPDDAPGAALVYHCGPKTVPPRGPDILKGPNAPPVENPQNFRVCCETLFPYPSSDGPWGLQCEYHQTGTLYCDPLRPQELKCSTSNKPVVRALEKGYCTKK
ncbi:hypothetical protein [Nevskia sp.]|uniref:hypothetical protein n=1 Tax=Nevskia sp. TaxID=1929292 RepID=UPI0025E57F0A|nr:hypothetical protein [Nevskia sp.]